MANKPSETVAIGAEDINVIRKFFEHFKLHIPEALNNALKDFEKEQTIENQEKIRAAIATAVVSDQSGLFDDKLFAPLTRESNSHAYYDHFNEHLGELLNKPEEPKD